MMRGINYSLWADYIYDIYDYYLPGGERVLELAAGISKISKPLSRKFKTYVISDKSLEMLKHNPLTRSMPVCFDMTAIPLKKEFDFIFSIFDSVNYLSGEEEFLKFLNEVKNTLDDEGIFTFDVSLENNSIKHLKHLNRRGNINGINYKQVSRYDPGKRIHLNTVEIEIDGETYKEVHKQKIHEFNFYFDLIEQSGMYAADCFNCFTFEDATSESERVQFIVRK